MIVSPKKGIASFEYPIFKKVFKMDEENYLELLEIESALKEEFKDCPDVKAFSNKTKEEDIQSENEASNKIFNCLECDKTFSSAEYLRRHKITHTGEKRYTCAKCDMRLSAPCFLETHEMLHGNHIHMLKCSK